MASEAPPPIFPERLSTAKTLVIGGVSFTPVEVSKLKMFPKGFQYIVAYRLKDGPYESPVAHLFCREREDIRPLFEKVAETYKQMKGALKY